MQPNFVRPRVIGTEDPVFHKHVVIRSHENSILLLSWHHLSSGKNTNLIHLISSVYISSQQGRSNFMPSIFISHRCHISMDEAACNHVDQQHHQKQDDDQHQGWMIMEDGDSSSSLEDLRSSNGSSSSSSLSDILDDASSSGSCSSTNSNSGPLYELSELMVQLPIKRGLSKYFQGKSQSFTSLSRVKSIEDLAKKETPIRKKMKACKSYGFGLDSHKLYTLPRATISKKVSRGSSSLSLQGRRSGSFLSSRPPTIPVQKNF